MSNFCRIKTVKIIDRLKNAAGGANALISAGLIPCSLLRCELFVGWVER